VAKGDKKARIREALQNSVITVVLLYLIIIVLTLFFSSRVLGGMDPENISDNRTLIGIFLTIPIIILIAVGYSLHYIYVRTRERHSSYRFRLKLVLIILLIVVLISLPQTVLSIRFMDMVFDRWFGDDVGVALNSGLDIALEYYFDLNKQLEDIGESPYFALTLSRIVENPETVWAELAIQYPRLDGMQIVSPDEVLLFGDPRLSYIRNDLLALSPGLIPKRTDSNFSILGYLKEIQLRGTPYRVVIYRIIPREFDRNARNLTQMIEKFRQYTSYSKLFRVGLLLFYSIFFGPMLFLGFVIALVISQRLIRPFLRLEEATRRVTQGDYSFRFLSRDDDDFAFLSDSFNTMMKELEVTRREILQTEKVSAWQEIAQRLAHEIRNPLTPIRLYSQKILAKIDDDELPRELVAKSMNRILLEVDNLNSLLVEFRDFARQRPPVLESLNFKDFIMGVTEVYEASYPKLSVITEHLPKDLYVRLDPGQFRQVFNNLLTNAALAMDGDGVIVLRTDLVKKGYSVYCRIQVSDSGPGIAQEDQEKIFNPYYTTREEGTGLGLSIVERIVFDHKGRIWVESFVGEGTTFYIDLPFEEGNGTNSYN
jgi:two-component system, NtrC family, nitrogen regulation sensor histidine kinase NtrY